MLLARSPCSEWARIKAEAAEKAQQLAAEKAAAEQQRRKTAKAREANRKDFGFEIEPDSIFDGGGSEGASPLAAAAAGNKRRSRGSVAGPEDTRQAHLDIFGEFNPEESVALSLNQAAAVATEEGTRLDPVRPPQMDSDSDSEDSDDAGGGPAVPVLAAGGISVLAAVPDTVEEQLQAAEERQEEEKAASRRRRRGKPTYDESAGAESIFGDNSLF